MAAFFYSTTRTQKPSHETVQAEELGASPTAADAEDSADLAGLAPEEAARKLASQNRLLRTKLRAVYRAEEENAKLRLQVEHLAEQLVRLPRCLCEVAERRMLWCHDTQAKRTVRLTITLGTCGPRLKRAALQLMWTQMLSPMRQHPRQILPDQMCVQADAATGAIDILTGRAGFRRRRRCGVGGAAAACEGVERSGRPSHPA